VHRLEELQVDVELRVHLDVAPQALHLERQAQEDVEPQALH
jgi:hypothetical protein